MNENSSALAKDVIEGVCNSGGADGSDLAWGCAAAAAGYRVRHLMFEGHRISFDAPQAAIILSEEQLRAVEPDLQRIKKVIGRSFPPRSAYSRNLLCRNWYQQIDAQSLYAIAEIEDGMIQGGSAWATALFIDRWVFAPVPVYVFDQHTSRWHIWNGECFEPMEGRPPHPEGIFAGIGIRKIKENGHLAIKQLFLS